MAHLSSCGSVIQDSLCHQGSLPVTRRDYFLKPQLKKNLSLERDSSLTWLLTWTGLPEALWPISPIWGNFLKSSCSYFYKHSFHCYCRFKKTSFHYGYSYKEKLLIFINWFSTSTVMYLLMISSNSFTCFLVFSGRQSYRWQIIAILCFFPTIFTSFLFYYRSCWLIKQVYQSFWKCLPMYLKT